MGILVDRNTTSHTGGFDLCVKGRDTFTGLLGIPLHAALL